VKIMTDKIRTTIPELLRPIAHEDGTLEGTLPGDRGGYVILPCDSGLVLLDGVWTPSQLRVIADYAERLEFIMHNNSSTKLADHVARANDIAKQCAENTIWRADLWPEDRNTILRAVIARLNDALGCRVKP